MYPKNLITFLFVFSTLVTHAATLTINFEGFNTINTGVFNVGPFSGTIVIDTDLAVSDGSGEFLDAITQFELLLNNAITVSADGVASTNKVTQVDNSDDEPDQGLLIAIEGGISDNSNLGDVERLFLDIRFQPGIQLFDDIDSLLNQLSDGDQFVGVPAISNPNVGDHDFFNLSVRYVGTTAVDSTILNNADIDDTNGGLFTTFTDATSGDPDADGDTIPDTSDNCIQVSNRDQRDTDSDGYGNVCDADLDNDCTVNFVDLGLLRARFFTDDADADFNADGVVNVIDLGVLRSGFFSPPGPSGTTTLCD
ncbi:MAG: thrombospondin type 3 repeat-containing protein [Pseudomonadota bacterium]